MSSAPFVHNPPGTTAGPAAVKSRSRQMRELLQMKAHCMLTGKEYHLYRFDERGKDYRYMLNFLTGHGLQSFRRTLNDPKWMVVLDNKWLFQLHYEQFGLPLPSVYGIYDPSAGFTRSGKPLMCTEDLLAFFREVRPPNLVVKPIGGIMGRQVLILSEIRYAGDAIHATTNTGAGLSFAELAEVLNRPPKVRFYASGYELDLSGYLLQAKLQQHEFLNEIAPYTTNTIRVVTFLNHNNDVDIHFTILRLGRRGNVADNWDAGGISVAIDPRSGVLGDGVLKPKHGGQWMRVHPDSGVRFAGRKMPHWDDILDVCARAARVTPRMRSVGWDVALTPDGPVIIEGNPDWDLAMVQVHTDGYLTPAIRQELAHFGLSFPENTLPPVSIGGWCRRVLELYRGKMFKLRGR